MEQQLAREQLRTIQTSAFAYELLRQQLLPDLLGKEAERILYWAGKNIARTYPLSSTEEMIRFFEEAGWGTLTVTDQKRYELHFELTGTLITERNNSKLHTTYELEAGFLAQQIQQQRNIVTEACGEQKKRTNKVLFTVQWDAKDHID